MKQEDFVKINDWLWEIPRSFRQDMKVPARIYISEKMLKNLEGDAIRQIINVATLPGIVKYSLAMPDAHSGYGFVIGGVAATKLPDGAISPGGIGYDQNCGCRLLFSDCLEKDVRPHLEKLIIEIQKQVPSGLGRGRQIKLSIEEIDKVLETGAKRLIEQGYGEKEDIENCEENGWIAEADNRFISSQAKNRGRDQLGTLGSGNHFCQLDKVDEIFDEKIAKVFGLFKNQVVIMVHTGSRGLGHQNCTDYLNLMIKTMPKYKIKLPDRELACVPFNSSEGQKFFKAMCGGANYAWANRQMITHYIRKAWQKIIGGGKLKLLYDVAHNIAKIEKHKVDGQDIELCVHRKGATRAFPPRHSEIPIKYREVGQPVLIPGTMGTASYVLRGTEKGKAAWFSAPHGAGRTMSRGAARRKVWGEDLRRQLLKQGIIPKTKSMPGLAEEAPIAYKDIDEVVRVVDAVGIARRVCRLIPLGVIKG